MADTSGIERAFGLLANGGHDVVEQLIGCALHRAGEWASPRESDGLQGFRVVARGPTRLRTCGRIWSIDQRVRSFWLDFARGDRPAAIAWTLYFDVMDPSPRRSRDAIDVIEDPTAVSWRVGVSGAASVAGDGLGLEAITVARADAGA
jgi:hypothetical protein